MPPSAPMKRFYVAVETVRVPDGYHITLDDRPIRTPGGRLVVIGDLRLAQALAAEWDAQRPVIDLKRMGLNQLVNSAIDRVQSDPDLTRDEIAVYAASDLLCYRAEAPAVLAARQIAAWDPLLDWASDRYGVRLKVTSGIITVEQEAAVLRALRAPIQAMDVFQLAALRAVTGLSGSLIVALAVAEGYLDAAAAWRAAQIDEDWQREKWGQDAEAAASQAAAYAAFNHAAHMLALLR